MMQGVAMINGCVSASVKKPTEVSCFVQLIYANQKCTIKLDPGGKFELLPTLCTAHALLLVLGVNKPRTRDRLQVA